MGLRRRLVSWPLSGGLLYLCFVTLYKKYPDGLLASPVFIRGK
jgi:hypothetical protein